MLTVFRICQAKHAASAFDGEGARRFGGRWSSRGTRVVYTSASLALAALETLVNLHDRDTLLEYSFVSAKVPPKLVLPVSEFSALPSGWSTSPAPLALQRIGDDWVKAGVSAVLEVPSSVIPLELNYLLNPLHPGFDQIKIGQAARFSFDDRLIKP
jgi:RES domain-containing protein